MSQTNLSELRKTNHMRKHKEFKSSQKKNGSCPPAPSLVVNSMPVMKIHKSYLKKYYLAMPDTVLGITLRDSSHKD